MTSRLTKKRYAGGSRRVLQNTMQGFMLIFVVSVGAMVFQPGVARADLTDDLVSSGLQRTNDAVASQQAVDDLQEATDKIDTQYQTFR